MLAMLVNVNVGNLTPRVALRIIANKLAPTGQGWTHCRSEPARDGRQR